MPLCRRWWWSPRILVTKSKDALVWCSWPRFLRKLKFRTHAWPMSWIEHLKKVKTGSMNPGEMAGKQWRLIGNVHVSVNLRLSLAGVDNLESFLTKRESRKNSPLKDATIMSKSARCLCSNLRYSWVACVILSNFCNFSQLFFIYTPFCYFITFCHLIKLSSSYQTFVIFSPFVIYSLFTFSTPPPTNVPALNPK